MVVLDVVVFTCMDDGLRLDYWGVVWTEVKGVNGLSCKTEGGFLGTLVSLTPVCLVDPSIAKLIYWDAGLGVVIVLVSCVFWADDVRADGWR